MNIILNGKRMILDDQVKSGNDLLIYLGIKSEFRIFEYNGDIINSKVFCTTCFKENDVIEIVQFMGGGS